MSRLPVGTPVINPLSPTDESCRLEPPNFQQGRTPQEEEEDCECGGPMIHSILSIFLLPRIRLRQKTFADVNNCDENEPERSPKVTGNSDAALRTSRTEPSLRALLGSWALSKPAPALRGTTSSSSSSSSSSEPSAEVISSPIADRSLPTAASDLSFARPVWIVTTAALPWMTGTAVNPLLRAAYLAVRYQQQQTADDEEVCSTNPVRRFKRSANVHLVVPWLESAEDRMDLYGNEWSNATADDQSAYILDWVSQHVEGGEKLSNNESETTNRNVPQLRIHWYPARYHSALGSIFAMGDVCARLSPLVEPDAICILEEPEHLNYYRGGQWRRTFGHVAGIIHTNYVEYCRTQTQFLSQIVGAVSAWMVRAYCDKVISLSATLPAYAPEKEVVCNVHGVRREFFRAAYHPPSAHDDSYLEGNPRQIYFLGKLLWAKGLDRLLQLQHFWKEQTGGFFPMDIYGSGPDQVDMEKAFAGIHTEVTAKLIRRTDSCSSNGSRSYTDMAIDYWRGESKEDTQPLPVTFCGRCDHAVLDRDRSVCYKIFVNPSVSEVLCTVTAEAIAMGKFVIIPNHPSNTFFQQFSNCLQYDDSEGFCSQLHFALQNEPVPLGDHQESLTWEGATDRLILAAAITHEEAARRDIHRNRDQRLADWHIRMGEGTTGDVLRQVLGGGPVAKQSCYEFESDPTFATIPPSSCDVTSSDVCSAHGLSGSHRSLIACSTSEDCAPMAIAVP
jgi:digalactosyldiacylglycerol synthase